MVEPMVPLLSFEAVTMSYETATRKVPAIRELTVAIRQGEFVTVSGPSGSGKSTFLHVAGCLDTPTSGTVRLNGVDVSSLSDDERARLRSADVGFVFQQYNLFPRMTTLDNVALPLVYARVPRAERRKRAADMLAQMNLAELGDSFPNQLSGGQQQRIAIARALIHRPRLLLADEPTGALDSASGRALVDLLRALNESGTTVVLVTHEPEVARAGRRRIRFHDGELVGDQSSEQAP